MKTMKEDGIPIMASFNLDSEINHLKQGPRQVKLETVGLQCSSGDGTVGAKTGVDLTFFTPEGLQARATFQVTRPPCSVSKMCEKGKSGGVWAGWDYVEHIKSGQAQASRGKTTLMSCHELARQEGSRCDIENLCPAGRT